MEPAGTPVNPRLSRSESEDPKGDILRAKIIASGGSPVRRPERDGFVQGVAWIISMFEAASAKSGPSAAAVCKQLQGLFETFREEAPSAAVSYYPDFEPPKSPPKKKEPDSGP